MELSVLWIYQQISNKIIKNNENKKKNSTFESHEFIHFIADLIGPFPIEDS